METVTIQTANKQHIKGMLFYPKKTEDKNPAVLFLHGWSSDETGYKPRAEALAKLGFICLTISIRGHGSSDGKLKDFSRADHLEDVLHAYDFLATQKYVDRNNISVMGTSYGGYLAATLAGKRMVKHLALRAPALYYNKNFTVPTAKLIADKEEEFFQNIHPEEDNFPLNGVKQIKGSLLLIVSEKDQIIPYFIIELYKTAAKKPVTIKIIKDADHQISKGEWKQELIAILASFFAKKS